MALLRKHGSSDEAGGSSSATPAARVSKAAEFARITEGTKPEPNASATSAELRASASIPSAIPRKSARVRVGEFLNKSAEPPTARSRSTMAMADACQPGASPNAQIRLDRVLKHELWYDYGYVISYGLD